MAYAIFVGMFVFRQLTLDKLLNALKHSVTDIGMIMPIIMFSSMIGYDFWKAFSRRLPGIWSASPATRFC